MLGAKRYRKLAEEGKLPPREYVVGGQIIQIVGIVIALFAPWPDLVRIVCLLVLLAFGEIVIQYGWPFYKRQRSSS